jgi:hypothetical protein
VKEASGDFGYRWVKRRTFPSSFSTQSGSKSVIFKILLAVAVNNTLF